MDDLDDLLRRVEGLRDLDAHGALADAPDQVAHDGEVDVGLEQGDADLAEDLVDVVRGQRAALAEPGEDAVEAVRE